MRCIQQFVLTFLSIAFFWSNASAGNSALDKAVLHGDWETVHSLVTDSTAGSNVIYDFLMEVSCLALDLDCAPALYETSPRKGVAGKTIEKWIKSLRRNHKRNAFLSYLMANNFSRSGDHKKALKELKQAVKQDSNFALFYLARSRIYVMMNEIEHSLKDVSKAIRLDPDNSMAYTLRGSIFDSQSKYQTALKNYEDAIRLKPERAANYYNRANTFRHMNQNSEAISDYTQAITLDSTLIGAYFNRGNVYFDEAELNEALIDYRKFVAIGSEEFNRQLQEANSQIRIIERIMINAPRNKADVLVELGFINVNQNDYDGAIKQLNKALTLDSTKSDAYYWRALASWRLGKQQKAIDDFTQSIHYHPKDTTAFFNRGALFVETDRLNDAIRDFSFAIELNPQYVMAYENRAKAFESLGHIDSAITDYKAMLKAIPDSTKERREKIKDLIEYLVNPNKVYDTKEIKKVVEKAYKLWEKQKWAQFAKAIFYDDLESFQKKLMPFALIIFEDYAYVMVNGIIYQKDYMLNTTPDQFFTIKMASLANNRSALRMMVTIKFIEVAEIIPRGSEHAIARIRIRIDSEDGKQEILVDNDVELIFSGWKIRMPLPIQNMAEMLGNSSGQR